MNLYECHPCMACGGNREVEGQIGLFTCLGAHISAERLQRSLGTSERLDEPLGIGSLRKSRSLGRGHTPKIWDTIPHSWCPPRSTSVRGQTVLSRTVFAITEAGGHEEDPALENRLRPRHQKGEKTEARTQNFHHRHLRG